MIFVVSIATIALHYFIKPMLTMIKRYHNVLIVKKTELSRLITQVAINKPGRDYSKMSSNEMLSVLESGDSRQVGEMFDQVGGGDPALGKQYHDTTKKLLDGQSLDKVEKDLQKSQSSKTNIE